MSVLFQNAAGQVLDDPAGFLRLNWSDQPRTNADVPALLTAVAQHLSGQGYDRILANQVRMVPFTSDEQYWIATQWLPAAVTESGYRFGAILVSNNVLARLATAYITTNVQNLPLRYRSFDVEEEAVRWLLKQ